MDVGRKLIIWKFHHRQCHLNLLEEVRVKEFFQLHAVLIWSSGAWIIVLFLLLSWVCCIYTFFSMWKASKLAGKVTILWAGAAFWNCNSWSLFSFFSPDFFIGYISRFSPFNGILHHASWSCSFLLIRLLGPVPCKVVLIIQLQLVLIQEAWVLTLFFFFLFWLLHSTYRILFLTLSSSDGTALFADCRICVWNAVDGSLVHSLTGHTESVSYFLEFCTVLSWLLSSMLLRSFKILVRHDLGGAWDPH